MICLIISNVQHQDSLLLAIQKFVMKCESWYDAEIAQLQGIVSLHTPFPGLQSSVSQFMKAEQSNLMILSIAEHNISCQPLHSERKNNKVEWKTFESILKWKSAFYQLLPMPGFSVHSPWPREPGFSSFVSAWWIGPWCTFKLEATMSAT